MQSIYTVEQTSKNSFLSIIHASALQTLSFLCLPCTIYSWIYKESLLDELSTIPAYLPTTYLILELDTSRNSLRVWIPLPQFPSFSAVSWISIIPSICSKNRILNQLSGPFFTFSSSFIVLKPYLDRIVEPYLYSMIQYISPFYNPTWIKKTGYITWKH